MVSGNSGSGSRTRVAKTMTSVRKNLFESSMTEAKELGIVIKARAWDGCQFVKAGWENC